MNSCESKGCPRVRDFPCTHLSVALQLELPKFPSGTIVGAAAVAIHLDHIVTPKHKESTSPAYLTVYC